MENEPPMNEPRMIWQSQKIEEIDVSLIELKHKADRLRTRALWTVIANDITCAGLVVFFAFLYTQTPNVTSGVGLALLAVGALYVAYRKHKQLWPLSVAPNTSPVTGVEAYRRELVRTQTDSRDFWGMLAPLLPGSLLFALPGIAGVARQVPRDPKTALLNAVPLCVLLVVWLTLVFPMRRRRLRQIQQEIDHLDGLLRTSS